ncbi:hypothetical protein J1614_001099 [Plenodomus biglobosus]|nr:hypothetical protein J1614_001099 [Plenodomus biglobosus]
MFKRTFASAFGLGASEVAVDDLEQQTQQRPSSYTAWFQSKRDRFGSQPRSTVIGTMRRWVGTAIAFAVPRNLVDRYPRVQQIIAIPVISNEGSLKKRLIEAFGLEEESLSSRAAREEAQLAWVRDSPSPLTRALMNTRASRLHTPSPPSRELPTSHLPTTSLSPDIWSPGFNEPTPQRISPITFNRITPPSTPIIEHESPLNDEDEDDDLDISLDFSFSDILTSTLPRNNGTGSPVPIDWNSPSIYAPASPSAPIPQPDAVTPVSENLLKQQLRRTAELSDIEEETSFEMANESIPVVKSTDKHVSDLHDDPSSPFESDVESPIAMSNTQTPSPAQSDADSSPFQSEVDSSPFQSEVGSSPFQSDIGSPTPAPTQEYDNDLSFLDDASPLPVRRTVRWAHDANIKPFYLDDKVSEMQDSTLETITSSPIRRDNAWEELLEESEMSEELLQDLHNAANVDPTSSSTSPVHPKPLVLPLDTPEMAFLEKMAEASEFGRDADFSIVDEKLKARDFATLLPSMFNGDPKAWLNDNIVNEYLSILVEHKKREAGFKTMRGGPAPPVHAFSSFWYTSAKKSTESVRRWASRFQLAGTQYLDADLVLYPICDAGHWRLIAVKPKARSVEYLDSLGCNGTPYIAKIFEYLKMELKEAFIAEEWTVVEAQRSSRQLNGSDCGVFTVLNALALLRGEEVGKVIACDGMIDARERIATTLMAGIPTTEME